jgi:hypothetical protein
MRLVDSRAFGSLHELFRVLFPEAAFPKWGTASFKRAVYLLPEAAEKFAENKNVVLILIQRAVLVTDVI